MNWIAGVYAVNSLLTFALYGNDKRKARLGKRRVPESVLHLWELAGGWPGAWVAQRVFRHKTQKRSFRLVYWSIVVLHLVLWGLWGNAQLN
ncbi:MAG: uncharacterized membrane protein YsdA (DUF1294 family) [Candidatus Paceibacteria bacterium]|jgi:uncharacterized membrane protein YsdA (DUF1294 family)